MRIRSLVPLAAVLLVAGGCGRLTGSGSEGTRHPTGADELILRVETGGGFIAPSYSLRQIPGFSLYGDGRVITQGAQIEIYPGPALPSILETRLTEDGIQAILEAARDAGLFGPDRHYDYPGIADAPTTTFTLDADGAEHVISAYALGEGQDATGLSEEDAEARAKLARFQGKLTDLRSWLPGGSVGDEAQLSFDELRVYVQPYAQAPDQGLVEPKVDWPLDPPLSTFGEPVTDLQDTRCGAVSGDELTALLPLVRGSNKLTPWTSAGSEFLLLFRPLLPNEHGC